MPKYNVKKIVQTLPANDWNSAVWEDANIVNINHFYPYSSDHRPNTCAKLLWDDLGLHILFNVKDNYVVCKNTTPQSQVCKDSCVEAFLKPKENSGYFNFEFNCGGALLVYYIEDARRADKGFAKYTILPDEDLKLINIKSSMPKTVIPELNAPTDWQLKAFIPWALFKKYIDNLRPIVNSKWRGNFYKCADHSSHPHWASWSVIEGEFGFHKPDYFGEINFV